MEFLKSNLIIIFVFLFFTQGLSAQDFETELKAFQESYLLEASGETQKAGEALKKVYKENSYEINVRLGWLSYQSGLFTESLAFYSKAINLKPLSIEAKFGYIYPASAMGNWDQVVNQYKKILIVDGTVSHAPCASRC